MTKDRGPESANNSQREQTTAEFINGLNIKELMRIRRKLILNSVLLLLVTIAFEVYAITAILPCSREGVLFALMTLVFLGTLMKLIVNGYRITLANDRIDSEIARTSFD